ncbi:hypothetical protein [Azospirillum argentinense]|uniref:YkgJ family cysteine cluster protein n=1 Tax=Azospirillum brasilense TaxID=192 RepID=A0A4D8PXM3_AZOBR|nr:hypothetical protein [Azospirillum argentinense]QCO03334.1 hypothetical protein D3867_14620 [Azospirillum argentinense]
MGEAKRQTGRTKRIVVGTCSGCTLCCVVPAIEEFQKPPFSHCLQICDAGCAIHRAEERPEVCSGFRCRYIQAHEYGSDERHILPHPLQAGAYAFEPLDSGLMVLCVDPARPYAWKETSLVPFLATFVEAGFTLHIVDRGYNFPLRTLDHLGEIVARDYVEGARLMGKPPNIPGYIGSVRDV